MVDAIHVWVVDLDVPCPTRNAEEILSAEERRTAGSMTSAVGRARFETSHRALRTILGLRMGIDPADLHFDRLPGGKPTIRSGGGLEFNLAHSGNRALVAVSSNRVVGVDLEKHVPFDFSVEAGSCLTVSERRHLAGLPHAERLPAFFDYWTCKEAFVKASGAGLALRLDTIEVSQGADTKVVALRDHRSAPPQGWTVDRIGVGPGYSGALVYPGPRTPIRVCLVPWVERLTEGGLESLGSHAIPMANS